MGLRPPPQHGGGGARFAVIQRTAQRTKVCAVIQRIAQGTCFTLIVKCFTSNIAIDAPEGQHPVDGQHPLCRRTRSGPAVSFRYFGSKSTRSARACARCGYLLNVVPEAVIDAFKRGTRIDFINQQRTMRACARCGRPSDAHITICTVTAHITICTVTAHITICTVTAHITICTITAYKTITYNNMHRYCI